MKSMTKGAMTVVALTIAVGIVLIIFVRGRSEAHQHRIAQASSIAIDAAAALRSFEGATRSLESAASDVRAQDDRISHQMKDGISSIGDINVLADQGESLVAVANHATAAVKAVHELNVKSNVHTEDFAFDAYLKAADELHDSVDSFSANVRVLEQNIFLASAMQDSFHGVGYRFGSAVRNYRNALQGEIDNTVSPHDVLSANATRYRDAFTRIKNEPINQWILKNE